MLHSNVGQTNFIGTHESIYRDSPIGNLEESRIVEVVQSPLQQGFDGDILARLTVRIDNLTALLASEQGIVSAVSLPNSTAVGTEFGRMPTVHYVQRNILVKAPLDNVLLKSKERNTHDFTIESLSFRTETFKVFNRNVGIIPQSQLSNIPNDLTYTILHKVMLISFSNVQCLVCMATSGISITLQNSLPFKNLLPANPDILSEIVLMQNLSFWRNNRNRKAFAIHINSKNILLQRQFNVIFGKIRNEFKSGSQAIGCATPPRLNQIRIPLEVAILDNRDSDTMFRINCKFNKGHRTSFKVFRNIFSDIEFQSNSFGLAFASPYRTFNITDNIRMKVCALFAGTIDFHMEIHESGTEVPFIPQSVELRSRNFKCLSQFKVLFCGCKSLQQDASLHSLNSDMYLSNINKLVFIGSPTRLKSWVFRTEVS